MNDGGKFRAEPTGERVVARRGRPLGTRIAAIVAVVLIAASGSSVAIAYPFVHSAAVELSRSNLQNEADALSHFLTGSMSASSSLPAEIIDLLRNHQVSAVIVAPNTPIEAPMQASDAQAITRARPVSDMRHDANGTEVLFELRTLTNGYSLYLTQPDSVADQPTRLLLLKMGYASLVVLVTALAAVLFYTRRATAPIRHVVEAAERMADGARDVRLVEGGVAEIADLSRSMNELSDALARSEDRQRQFLLSVSHELRTPLTAIAGYAEALADGVITDDDVEPTGVVMRAESDRLQRLVSDLLDLSRAGAVELRLDPREVDLTELVRGAGRVWQARCDREGVSFGLELPDGPVSVVTDAVRVRQLIDNLCENALRVTPEGRPLILALRSDDQVATVEVRDGGPGLSEDDMRVAFQPSALHDRYIGIRPVGTGVGLALVGTLAQRLGGSAVAGRSAEGGAAFQVRLPQRWHRSPA